MPHHTPRTHPSFASSSHSRPLQPASSRITSPERNVMQNPTVLVQLVTRIPWELRRRARIHCAKHDSTLTRFVTEAIVERLAAENAAHAAVPIRRSASR